MRSLPLGTADDSNTALVCSVTGQSFRICRELGRGEQGVVYEVIDDEGVSLALKVFFSSYSNNHILVEQRLRKLLLCGTPHLSFCWPLGVFCFPFFQVGSLGYTMPLIPSEFVPCSYIYNRSIYLRFLVVLRACQCLAEAFSHLHGKGFVYADYSLNNIYINPVNGRCLIVDVDNVCSLHEPSKLLGTSPFIAPELVNCMRHPDIHSELHSIAVLFFCLIFLRHPFRGRHLLFEKLGMPLSLEELREEGLCYILDRDVEFTFNEFATCENLFRLEKILPSKITSAFRASFVEGLFNPLSRVSLSRWKTVFGEAIRMLDRCPSCGQEIFIIPDIPDTLFVCWFCRATHPPILR